MSKTISNSDLAAVVGYLDSFIAQGCDKTDLRKYNYVRRCILLRNRLKNKVS